MNKTIDLELNGVIDNNFLNFTINRDKIFLKQNLKYVCLKHLIKMVQWKL
jgi:hypothetical protein